MFVQLGFVLPVWNSAESVKIAHFQLENASEIFFVLLLLFEVAAIFWKPWATLLGVVGLVCFGLAIVAEHYASVYGARQNELHDADIGRDFEKRIKYARESASAEQRAEVEKLNHDAELANIAIQNLQNQSRVRVITSKQREYLIEKLKPLAPHRIKVISIRGDSEAVHYAQLLANAIDGAGWKIEELRSADIQPTDVDGVELWLPRLKVISKANFVLCESLQKSGTGCNERVTSNVEEDVSFLVVGHKPRLTKISH